MKRNPILGVLAILFVLSAAPLCLAAPTLTGDYLEARSPGKRSAFVGRFER